MKTKLTTIFLIAASFFVYLFFALPDIGEPLTGDNILSMLVAKIFNNNDLYPFISNFWPQFGFWHPTLYMHMMAVVGKLFGMTVISIRMIGISAFLASLVLIYLIAEELYKETGQGRIVGFLACFIYAVIPLAIRSSLLIDIDGAVLHPTILLLIFMLTKDTFGVKNYKRVLGYGIVLAACLWVKNGTPLILISSLFLYYLVKREKKILQIMGIGAVGLILFNATWRLYGMITNWPIEKLYINARTNLFCFFVKNIESGSLPTLLKTIWLTLTWSSPALLAAAFLSSAQALKEPDTRKGLVSKGAIAAYGLMVYIIYILFRGQTYGITKYHSTALGVFAILIAGTVINEFIDNRALIRKSILAVLFLTGLYLWLVGDPVYIINYVLKKDMILTGGENAVPIIAGAISSLTIILFSVAACFLWLKKICVKKPVYLALFITGIAFCLSLSTIQILAEYNTVYSYGTSGTKDAIKFVEDATDKDDIIFGPPEIIWGVETNLQSYKYSLQINRWTIKEIFEDTLRKNNIKCLVYGIGSNTINSYRNIFLADEVITMLKKRYNRTDIGSFTIWVQK